MKCQTQRRLMRACVLLVVFGGALQSVSMLGLTGWALASDPLPWRLHVDSGRLTGQLTQVTLRKVLGQLHDQLGIDCVAPDAELGKVISVVLQKEPLVSALSKILAPWDYAFTLDAGGNIKTLYVTAKVLPESPLADSIAKNRVSESRKQRVSELKRPGPVDHGSGLRREDRLNKQVSRSDLTTREKTGTRGEVFTKVAVPMEVRPPAPGTSMPILPANRKGMQITPVGSAGGMEIIPPAAYPPMNIQPVPEHMKQEMLLTLNP